MEPVRVLIVEDNSVVADAVAEGLRDQGMAVDVAYDGPAGLDKVTVNTYDVIVLDRDLPRLHGDVLCQQIVDSPSTSRILMLTAAALVEDRAVGLVVGVAHRCGRSRISPGTIPSSLTQAARPRWPASMLGDGQLARSVTVTHRHIRCGTARI